MKNQRSRGRPRKSEITRLKVMAWFNAVELISRKRTSELEREFSHKGQVKRVNGREIRPKLWDKYCRGDVEPRSKPSKTKEISLVQEVESRYPGTAKWLTLPLWRLLDFSQPITMDELREIYEGMPPEIRHLTVKENVLEGEIFWRKQTDEVDLLQQIEMLNEVEGLSMAVALIREAEVSQHESSYKVRIDKLLARLKVLEKLIVSKEVIFEFSEQSISQSFLNDIYAVISKQSATIRVVKKEPD